MSKLFDSLFKANKGPVDDKERLCDNICSVLNRIIDDRDTVKNKKLIVWLDNVQPIIFAQYDNEKYRDILLASLAQKGFEFEQVEFKMGNPTEDNHNVFKIEDNDHEYLEVVPCDVVQHPSLPKKARLSIMEGLCVIEPLQKEYVLSSEEITSGRITAYNIGRGSLVQKDGVFRENHIVFDDRPDSPLWEHNRCVSRFHAHIGFDASKGFFFQVDEGGAYPGKTLLFNGGKTINCDCVTPLFYLQDGDKIIVKNGQEIEVMLVYNEINN